MVAVATHTNAPPINDMMRICGQASARGDGGFVIYGLCDPVDLELRYIGKAKDPVRRYYLHLCDSQLRRRSHRNNWIKRLLKNGEKPVLVTLDMGVRGEEWQDRERFWIRFARSTGCSLTNATDGGDGLSNPSAETRFKCGSSNRGKRMVFTDEHKAKIAAANRERWADPTWRAKMIERMASAKRGKKSE